MDHETDNPGSDRDGADKLRTGINHPVPFHQGQARLLQSDRHGAGRVIPTPFGLVRLWESNGNTFLAEVSSDGTVIGAVIPLVDGSQGAVGASAVVHALPFGRFRLTAAWMGSATGMGPALVKSWDISRGPAGLRLDAANDNPRAIASKVLEVGITALRGDLILLNWVDENGRIVGYTLPPEAQAPGETFIIGHTTVEAGPATRRVHAVELAPLEFAVFWLASGGHEVEWSRFARDAFDDDGAQSSWVRDDPPALALPDGFAGGLRVQAVPEKGSVLLSYEVARSDGRLIQLTQPVLFPAAPAQPDPVPANPLGLAVFPDVGILWASQDILQLDPSVLVAPHAPPTKGGPLRTQAEDPLVIDPSAFGAPPHVKIVAVDGSAVAEHTPVRVASGWLQTRTDGALTFTPDVDASGHVPLSLSGLAPGGARWQHTVDVHIDSLAGEAKLLLRNAVQAIPPRAVVTQNAQIAEIGIAGDGAAYGAIGLSGHDADKFVVIGNGLFLRAGTKLDPGKKKLDVSVTIRDGLVGAAVAASLTVAILNDPASYLSLAIAGRAEASDIREGTVVASLGVLDPSAADRITLALLHNAGGRFALSGGNLVIASPQIFELDAATTYDVVVRMSQPNGIAVDHKVTLHHEDIVGRPAVASEPGAIAPVPDVKPGVAQNVENEANTPVFAKQAPSPDMPDADVSEHAAVHEGQHGEAGEHVEVSLHAEGGYLGGLHVAAVKGSAGLPDLGSAADASRKGGDDGLSKLLADQRGGGDQGRDGGDRGSNDRGEDRGSSSDSGRGSGSGKSWLESSGSGDDGHGGSSGRSGNSDGNGKSGGSGHSGDHDGLAALNDTLVFKQGFGKETIDHVKQSGGEPHDVVDLSLYGTTFEAMRAAGAFDQVAADVNATTNPADPAHPDKLVPKAGDMPVHDPSDFKHS